MNLMLNDKYLQFKQKGVTRVDNSLILRGEQLVILHYSKEK